MITERKVIGKLEILESEEIQIREDTVIERDGVELTRVYHRRVLLPGDDISRESDRIRRVTALLWTPEVIQASRAKRAKALEDLGVRMR